jgi:pimeloyl-ACP methyl ester carboxylesterase
MIGAVTGLRSFDGTGIEYETIGDTGGRPPLLLLHGFAADSQRNWVRPGIAGALVSAGHRVVMMDARGHGRSDRPHDPEAYADGAMAKDVSCLIDVLGVETVDLVGYSMGSLTSLEVCRQDPRPRSAVLGGVGGAMLRSTLDRKAIAGALSSADPTGAPPTARAFRRFAELAGADLVALSAIQRARRAPPPDLAALRLPVLVIAGDDDRLAGPPGELALAIPGGRAAVISGNHLTAVFDADLPRLIEVFLDQVEARAGA